MIAAEREGQKIAVEIKSFIGPPPITSFHLALGQYLNYFYALQQQEPDRKLYLAIPRFAYEETFDKPIVQLTLKNVLVHLLVFDLATETIHTWKS